MELLAIVASILIVGAVVGLVRSLREERRENRLP